MRKIEWVYKEILRRVMEDNKKLPRLDKARVLSQSSLASALGVSLSTVHHALVPLRRMSAIKVGQRNFTVTDAKKILLYWAGIRNIDKDILYKTRASGTVSDIEKRMPPDVIFAAYSAYKFMFKDIPADYAEVYVYASDLAEMKKRFPPNKNPPNLFVLKKDFEKMTLAHIFVDLWNLGEWYAKDFLKAVGENIDRILA